MPKRIDRREAMKLSAATGLAIGTGTLGFAADKKKPLRLGVVGTGRRGRYLLSLALRADVEVTALCDIREPNLKQAQDMAEKACGRRPEGYSKGAEDYLRMLRRDDLDAIIIGTGMQLHAPVAIAAMKAGKHVLSEVSGAMTLDECWGLVRTTQETGMIYMLAENCCYWHELMMVQNMVDRGIFGAPTYAECGYVHDCRYLKFNPDGSLTWRGEMTRDWPGNNYPTHSLGPVANWLGINRGDRLVSLVASATGSLALQDYIDKHLPKDSPIRKVKFKGTDSSTALIKTAKGVLIDLRFDISSSRPTEGPYHALQGVNASYDSRIGQKIWIEGRTKGHKWEPIANYKKEFEHPLWTRLRDKAKGSGHGGGDFFVMHEFLEAIGKGGPSPIDVYDSAVWSAILPLTAKSLDEGGSVVEIPDFTEGKWKSRKA